jgi:Uma2 family endonuclease
VTQPAAAAPSFEELYLEIERLPQGVTGEILENGVVHTMSRPGRAHRHAAKWVGEALRGFDRTLGGSGWWIEPEAEVRLPDDRLVVPDLSGWRVEDVPELPEDNPITIVPAWCCEVLSPKTFRVDRLVKLPLYSRNGVAWIWLVDPLHRIVEVFETVNGRATLTVTGSDNDVLELLPFAGDVDLTRWWMPKGRSDIQRGG